MASGEASVAVRVAVATEVLGAAAPATVNDDWAERGYADRLAELRTPRPLIQYVVGESDDAPYNRLEPLQVGDRTIGWRECLLFIVRPFTLPLPAGLGPKIVQMCDRLGANERSVIVQVGTRGEWESHPGTPPDGWVGAMYDGVLAIQPRAVILDNSAESGTKFYDHDMAVDRRARSFGVPVIREANRRTTFGFGAGYKVAIQAYLERAMGESAGKYCQLGDPGDSVAIINAVWRDGQDSASRAAIEAASIALAEQGASVVIPHHQAVQRWEPLRQAYERRLARLAAAAT